LTTAVVFQGQLQAVPSHSRRQPERRLRIERSIDGQPHRRPLLRRDRAFDRCRRGYRCEWPVWCV